MILEKQQIYQQYIELCSDENQNYNQSDETKQVQVHEKQKGSIFKPKRKKRKRLIWIPLIMKNILKIDTEPVYIFNLFKMMKKYDTDEIEKYKNYGIQDAGIGFFDSVKLDKVNQSIDVSLNTFFFGQLDFNNLIQLYKSYQNQHYYDLALVLQEYQNYIYKVSNKLQSFTKQNILQTNAEEDFVKIERIVKEWASNNLENDIYQIVIGNIDQQKGIPSLKKIIFSKNLLLLLGGELQETYDELSSQRNLDYLTNFVHRRQNTNGESELEHVINVLKGIVKNQINYVIDEEILTLDGYTIPTKKSHHAFYYNPETGEISKQQNVYTVFVIKYNFEAQWIKYLIDQRLFRDNMNQNNQADKQLMLQQTNVQNLEYICQKEYFLEKFNYTQ